MAGRAADAAAGGMIADDWPMCAGDDPDGTLLTDDQQCYNFARTLSSEADPADGSR